MAELAASNFKFATLGQLRWLEIPWTSTAHYWVLVKSTKTPAMTDSTYANISSNLCTSAGYAHQNATNKVFLSSANANAPDCDSPTFGDNKACKYLYLLSGTYSSPQSGDRIIGHWNLDTPGSADITINGPINLDAQGVCKFPFTSW
jgi:hypothetical protein